MADNWIPETRNRLAQGRAKKPDSKSGQIQTEQSARFNGEQASPASRRGSRVLCGTPAEGSRRVYNVLMIGREGWVTSVFGLVAAFGSLLYGTCA